MLVTHVLASLRKCLGKDAEAGGAVARDWVALLKGAYPEWSEEPLERSLAWWCVVARSEGQRLGIGMVESIEYWAWAANLGSVFFLGHYLS